ncbi:MAG: RDD family protein [Lachnospiraceae bacterium]|nr:RDD family protein [Lachnospiraceae bacterium]
MNDLTIRRAAAFIIDHMVLCAFASVAGMLAMILTADIWMKDVRMLISWIMLATFIFSVLLMGIYFFILDVCGKLDLGKRLVKIELLSDGQKFTVSTALKHTILKVLFCCIWPVSFCYYIIRHEMIYDRLLKISVRDRAAGF